jgi:hypothetical protein
MNIIEKIKYLKFILNFCYFSKSEQDIFYFPFYLSNIIIKENSFYMNLKSF